MLQMVVLKSACGNRLLPSVFLCGVGALGKQNIPLMEEVGWESFVGKSWELFAFIYPRITVCLGWKGS